MATFSNFKSTLVAAADIAAGASAAATTIVADMTALIALTGMSDGDQAFVTANNNLYFYSSGWYKIATVSNDSPSSITGVSGSYNLDISGGTTTITAVSTDPEGFPLTWSYSTSGLGSIATISQADNVFTITPSTNVANAGSFTLTISVTDGINGAVSTSSTLTLQFIVVNSKYTTSLIKAIDTSDNNNITDASSNNHTVTANGNATAGTFSPYRHGGYSYYFDGSSDYLDISAPGVDLGSGDFTVEAWVCRTAEGDTNFDAIFSLNTYDEWDEYPANVNINGFVLAAKTVNYGIGNTTYYTGGGITADNTWHHIAACRSSNTIKIYIDGTEVASVGDSSNYTANTNTPSGIGYFDKANGASRLFWNGYISNLRVVKGTAVYTSAFTPPTEALTAITNTQLLTCHLPYLVDGSSNNHSITVTGDVSAKSFSLYDNQEYFASDHGGSVYFDGSGDYLTIPSLGNNTVTDLTISFWVYPETSSVSPSLYPRFLTIGGTSTNNGFIIYLRDDNTIRFYSNGERIQSSTIGLNTWQHVILKRNSGTWRLLINGVTQGTYANSTTMDFTSSVMYVGRDGTADGYTKGYISDLKIEFSSDSSTSATVPTSPVSSSGAIFHVKGTDASIIDKAQTSNVILFGAPSGSTTQVKFASTKSMYFGNSNDYAISGIIPFRTGDFTIEAWVYLNSVNSTGGIFSSIFASGAIGVNVSQDQWWLGGSSSSNDVIVSGGSIFTVGQWQHAAIVRSGSTATGYVDGTSVGSVSSSRDLTSGSVVLGQRYVNNFNFSSNCYIQDLRVTTGLARYTSNFTPPTSELQG